MTSFQLLPGAELLIPPRSSPIIIKRLNKQLGPGTKYDDLTTAAGWHGGTWQFCFRASGSLGNEGDIRGLNWV